MLVLENLLGWTALGLIIVRIIIIVSHKRIILLHNVSSQLSLLSPLFKQLIWMMICLLTLLVIGSNLMCLTHEST